MATKRARVGRDQRSLPATIKDAPAARRTLLASEQSLQGKRVERTEFPPRLADALASLPEDQRRAIELRYLSSLRLDEVAHRLGRTGPEDP